MNKIWEFIKAFLSLLPFLIISIPWGIWYLNGTNGNLSMRDSIIGAILGSLFAIAMGALGKINKKK